MKYKIWISDPDVRKKYLNIKILMKCRIRISDPDVRKKYLNIKILNEMLDADFGPGCAEEILKYQNSK